MADRGDTHYHVPKLNLWFAVSSVILLVSAFWMVIDDWDRSWKGFQREFFQREIVRSRRALETPGSLAGIGEEVRLSAQLDEAEAALEARESEIEEAEEELFQVKGALWEVTEDEKSAKQAYNWERFLFEEGHSDVATMDEMAAKLSALTKEREVAEVAFNEQNDLVQGMFARRDGVEKDMKAAVKDVDLIRAKLAKRAPDDFLTQTAEIIRDFPGLDFIGPNIKVHKIVLEDLTFELNFTKKPRIDMCQTCHMSIGLDGWDEGEVHPYRSHPDLDLYLTAKSPHPVNKVGCSICHRGSGESLEFVRADHRPSDDAEAARWSDEYHWHKQHHWDYPMLESEHVEASCVQCHKTSMELIADDAPDVTEGYRLFERYGCYACHKVEWFPTKRRPGPSLKKVTQKTDPGFIASWIADPRGFRPSTWMPQFFHLENWPADETVVVSKYGDGRAIKGQEWNDTAVDAITAFLVDRSVEQPAEPIPSDLEPGDVLRGRESFLLSGCMACHNMAPFPGVEAESSDLALEERGTNEHGPNLRGLATKVTPQWLYHWIDDPSAYWDETRMPDLNLPPQDIADIVAYVFDDPDGYFSEVPEGWVDDEPPAFEGQREVLEEQARWYFANRSRAQFDQSFADEWKDTDRLMVELGERLVLGHGCHSCHEIAGLEDQMPIGAELTEWGSKTVDKLDWGFIPELFGEDGGWSHHEVEQFKDYRENWIVQKLQEPRSFDRGLHEALKVKNPTEKLKMPWFDFEPEEIEAITTFVIGQVKDEVQRARMVPTAGKSRMDLGLRAMRQKNCAACHVIEPGTVTYTDEDGERRTVAAQAFPLDDEEYIAPSLGEGFHPFLQAYEEYIEEDLEEVIVQVLRPEPGVGDLGESVIIEGVENVDAIETTPAWGGDFVPMVVDLYRNPWAYDENDEAFSRTADDSGAVRDNDGAAHNYEDEEYEKVRWTFAPPFLIDEGYKVQREWLHRFLLDPYPLRRQMRVKMPRFNWAPGEAGAVADYFAQAAARDYPVRYARRLLVKLEMNPAEVSAAMDEAGKSLEADMIQDILDGNAAAIETGFPKLASWASSDAVGFTLAPPVDPAYEAILPRTPTVLGAILEQHPDFFEAMARLTGHDPVEVDGAIQGPNCFQCHWLDDQPPNVRGDAIKWAPDLKYVRERLRPDWLREWLTNPPLIYPGTAMPANFGGEQWGDLWAKSSPEQIEDVMNWLFNLDRRP